MHVITIPSTHRGNAVYPRPTAYVCPQDGAPVVIDQWTRTTADHEGKPQEDSGFGFYCTNKSCEHATDAIDEDILDGAFEERRAAHRDAILSRFQIPPYIPHS